MSIDHACAVYIPMAVVLGWLTLMQCYGKLPSVNSIQSLAQVVNTKGGNILVLGAMSMVFFYAAIHLIYWTIERMMEGKLKPENAVIMMGLTFVTGTAFGGAFSSMLKAMSGEPSESPNVSTPPDAAKK